jgi:hypothetical protein
MVLTAIMILALMAVGALAVDLGNQWQARRDVITATDAAALAAAQDYAHGGNGCDPLSTTGAYEYVHDNRPSATIDDPGGCVATFSTAASGFVTVTARDAVDYLFGSALGKGSGTVTASTTARWGFPIVGGLRPFGLCGNDPGILAWLAAPTPGTTMRVSLLRGSSDDALCGASGNWGFLDLTQDNGGIGVKEMADWIESGYPGPNTFCVPVKGPGCDYDMIDAKTGNVANNVQVDRGVQQLDDDGIVFWAPVVLQPPPPGGSGAEYPVLAFVSMEILDHHFQGQTNWMDLRLDQVFRTPGVPCCPDMPILGSDPDLEICAVDPSFNPDACA